MISANELRIGNWYNDGYRHKKVTAAFIQKLQSLHKIKSASLRFYTPIPLTPEILEKAGFEFIEYEDITDSASIFSLCSTYKHKKSFYSYDYYVNVIDGKGETTEGITERTCFEFCLACPATDGELIVAAQIKYLHQLQNLYFALTGEELEINL